MVLTRPISPLIVLLAAGFVVWLITTWPALSLEKYQVLALRLVLIFSILICIQHLGGFAFAGKKMVMALGVDSMAIYLIHTGFSVLAREILRLAQIDDTWVHLGIGTAAGLVGPLLILEGARRIKLDQILEFR